MKLKFFKDKRGIVLISTYLALSVIGTFSLVVFTKNLSLYHASERTINRITAFHLAESGVDQAIVQLKNNLSYTGQGYTTLGRGGYDIQITTPDPVANPNLRLITTNGYTPNNLPSSYAYERRQVVAHVNFLPSVSTFAIFSDTNIQINGNAEARTDSYDSRKGSYASQTPGTNGNVGTNAIGVGSISLSGNVNIGGSVVVGPGGDPATVITETANVVIQGSTGAAPTTTILNPVVVPSNLTNLGALTAKGNDTVTLAGGTYWFTSVSITGKGKVNFTGPATVYVTGDVSIAGNGIETAQNLPPNLSINVAGTHNVSISGNGNFYGKLYVPDSPLSLSGNGQIFGALTGDSLNQSGTAQIHYDEALGSPNSGSALRSTLRAWVEN